MSKSKKLVIQKRVNRIVAAQKAARYVYPYQTGRKNTKERGWIHAIQLAYKAGFRAGVKERER